jgi:2-dehydropantoate 2-reductase
MRIVVVGAGGVGGYFGGLLAAAGNEVAFVARGPHLEAIRAHGLRLVGPRGETRVKTPAGDDAGTLGRADIILFCVKLYDTESAGETIGPLMGERTRLISLQNGVDGAQRLARLFGAERVLGGAAFVSAVIAEPGTVRYTSDMSKIVFGRLDGSADGAADAFRDACVASGFEAEHSREIETVLWTKMVLLATNAGLSSATRRPVRACYEDPETRQVAIAALREGEAIARARGIRLPPDIVDRSVERSRSFPPDLYASMYWDLDRGRRMELDGLSGLLVRLGAELGIPTPVHQTLYAVLKPYKDGAST